MRALLALVIAVTSFGALAVAVPAQAAADQPWSSYPSLDRDPLGANDWECRPTPERPYPAVIVHGTFGDRASLLDALSYSMKSEGYCVFALDYGNEHFTAYQFQQARILELICEGKLNKQIAYELAIADATVKAHVTALMRKLGVQTRTQAVLLARQASFSSILQE